MVRDEEEEQQGDENGEFAEPDSPVPKKSQVSSQGQGKSDDSWRKAQKEPRRQKGWSRWLPRRWCSKSRCRYDVCSSHYDSRESGLGRHRLGHKAYRVGRRRRNKARRIATCDQIKVACQVSIDRICKTVSLC